MTTSYRRFILAMLGTTAMLVVSAAGSGGVAAAAGLHATGAADRVAMHGVLTSAPIWATSGNGNGNQGGNGNGGSGSQGSGQGTATPELPSGILFGLGLIPLAVGVFLVWRRGRNVRS